MSATLLRVADLVLNRPLLLHPDKLAIIAQVLEGRLGLDASELAPSPDASRFVGSSRDQERGSLPYRRTEDGVAVVTVLGSLVNRGAFVGASSGVTSYEGIRFQLATAAADPKVRAILLDLDSPGGQAVGSFELAATVRAISAEKPVTAVVNGMAASAAYAIASGARSIITTPSGISGSIGVVMLHADFSRALDKAGVKPTLIHAGARKVDANPYEPLADGVRADLQAEVDLVMNLFVACVAAGRPRLTDKAIRSTEARAFIGDAAVKAGLADAVGTFEDALADLTRGTPTGRSLPSRTTTRSSAVTPQEENEIRADERARVLAIVKSPEAEGRAGQALTIACETTIPAADAVKILAASPKVDAAAATTAAHRQRLEAASGSELGPDGSGPRPKGESPIVAAAKRHAAAAAAARQR